MARPKKVTQSEITEEQSPDAEAQEGTTKDERPLSEVEALVMVKNGSNYQLVSVPFEKGSGNVLFSHGNKDLVFSHLEQKVEDRFLFEYED